jgi:hypothetical protein
VFLCNALSSVWRIAKNWFLRIFLRISAILLDTLLKNHEFPLLYNVILSSLIVSRCNTSFSFSNTFSCYPYTALRITMKLDLKFLALAFSLAFLYESSTAPATSSYSLSSYSHGEPFQTRRVFPSAKKTGNKYIRANRNWNKRSGISRYNNGFVHLCNQMMSSLPSIHLNISI